jgi:hypothetical protein
VNPSRPLRARPLFLTLMGAVLCATGTAAWACAPNRVDSLIVSPLRAADVLTGKKNLAELTDGLGGDHHVTRAQWGQDRATQSFLSHLSRYDLISAHAVFEDTPHLAHSPWAPTFRTAMSRVYAPFHAPEGLAPFSPQWVKEVSKDDRAFGDDLRQAIAMVVRTQETLAQARIEMTAPVRDLILGVVYNDAPMVKSAQHRLCGTPDVRENIITVLKDTVPHADLTLP